MRKLIAAGLFGATLAPAGLAAETLSVEPREDGASDSAPDSRTDRTGRAASAD